MVCEKGINDMKIGWIKEDEWNERVYRTWAHMLERCYCKKYQEKHPTYKGCYVCERWLKLSAFVEDIVKIENYEYWLNNPNERIALDKDIKSNNKNKCYCLEKCMFVNPRENSKQALKNENRKRLFDKEHPNSKEVLQYDKNMNFIKKWNCISTASKELNISKTAIANCLKGLTNSAGGFKWIYVGGNEIEY